MYLFICLLSVSPYVVFIINVITDINYAVASYVLLYTAFFTPASNKDIQMPIWKICVSVINTITLVLVLYAITVCMTQKTIVKNGQVYYYKIKRVLLLFELVFLIGVGFLLFPVIFWPFLFWLPRLLQFSWMNQLIKFSHQEKSAAVEMPYFDSTKDIEIEL